MQLTCSRLLVMKICPCMQTDERHLLHNLSLQQAKNYNSQKYRVTEWGYFAACIWVTSKLTHWYIHNIRSVASRAKGYQALPLLTFCCCHAGGESGNEAAVLLQQLHKFLMLHKHSALVDTKEILGCYIQWTQGPGTGDPGTRGPGDPGTQTRIGIHVCIHSTYMVHI